MAAVRNGLVVGGGAAGTAIAILLAEGGVSVDLIDDKPGADTAGSGITLQGNALRVLRKLGVWDAVLSRGYLFDTLGLRAPDPHGSLVAELDDVRTGGPDLPATAGMPRPALARILLDRAAEAGAKIRFGTSCTSFAQDSDGVDEYMRGTGRLLRAGVEKVWGPGRHLAGNNTFSYFLDPHGNTVEYTTELELLDEDTWHPHLYDFSDPMVTDQWGTANPMSEFIARHSFNDPDRGVFVAPPV